MSELLDTLNNRKFKRKIALSTEHCLSYIKKELVSADSSFQKSEEEKLRLNSIVTFSFFCFVIIRSTRYFVGHFLFLHFVG